MVGMPSQHAPKTTDATLAPGVGAALLGPKPPGTLPSARQRSLQAGEVRLPSAFHVAKTANPKAPGEGKREYRLRL